jgi:hypothetical protein
MNGCGGSASVSASARPRISSPRTTHGCTVTRSSTTNATRPFARTLRNFWLAAMFHPPMSIVPAAASTAKPTGLFCSIPLGATVASRPSRCDAK